MAQPTALSLFPELQRDLRAFRSTGILPCQRIRDLLEAGSIRAAEPVQEGQLQPASIDLRLGPEAFEVRASFLPGARATVQGKLKDLTLARLDLSSPTALARGRVYIIPLVEELHLPPNIMGKANPKSTVGRLDVFTRLLTDYGTQFERVPRGYRGKLYAEVAPRTFSVLVHAGTRLNQLRFMRGNPPPSDTSLQALHQQETLIYLDGDEPGPATIARGLWISIDLRGSPGRPLVGYRARRGAPVIDLDRVGYYDPREFWEPIASLPQSELVLQPDDFYLLASRERIRVPPSFAAEMVSYDPFVGEFRIHYAGFFDPGFGYGSDDVKGTRAVLEVRSHEVPFLLRDGQLIGRLIYERLLGLPEKVYGPAIGSSYQQQEVALSKQFRHGGASRPDM